jgi:membrane protease YdiL (CAAX protease family)
MLPVFVRRKPVSAGHPEAAGEGDDALLPTELVPEKGVPRVDAMTLVAREKDGPWVPLLAALETDEALLAAFARALDVPSLKRVRPLRTWMLAGLVPLLVLAELERELWVKGAAVGARMAADAFLGLAVAIELLRPVPPRPRTVALVFFAVGARYAYMILVAKGHGLSPVIWGAPAIALGAGALAWLLPPRKRLVAEVAARLGLVVPKGDRRPPIVPGALPKALAAAFALPLVLFVARKMELGLWQQAGVFLVTGALASTVAASSLRGALARGWPRTGESIAYGLVRTFGLAGLTHHLAGCIGELWKLVSAEGFAQTGSRFFEAEATESSRQVEAVKTRLAFVAMTVLFGPIVEEMVYRGGLQRAIAQRAGKRTAIVLAGTVFAVAHVNVYQAALWQTVFLGVAFGLALEEGGILCAIAVHALWNAWLLA